MRGIVYRQSFRMAKIALGCLLFCGLPTAAQANGLLLIGPQIGSSLLIMLASGSHCIGFTYDVNGNRTSQAVSTIGSGPTLWGSGTFGCFVWDQ